jgi:arsenate reductase
LPAPPASPTFRSPSAARFSNTFAGIAPASIPAFIIAQLIGAAIAAVILRTLYPDIQPADAAQALVLHPS